MRNYAEYTIFNNATPVAITSSTNATPIVVTATAHGLTTGQLVLIQGHVTNTAANGIFRVGVTTANTFQLLDRYTGANVVGNGVGGNTGFCVLINVDAVLVEDFMHAVAQIDTSGSATVTFQAVGSVGKLNNSSINKESNSPNLGMTASPTNPYGFMQVIDYNTGSAINGTTGIVVAGTDINNLYEFNVNGLKYVNFIPTTWTQGALTLKLQIFSNK